MKKSVLILAALFCVLASWAQQNLLFSPKATMAKELVKTKAATDGIALSDLDQMKVSSETYSNQSGITNVYFQQTVNGIPVFNAMMNVHVTRDNKLLTYGNRFVRVDAAARMGMTSPALTPEQAVNAAMTSLGMPAAGLLEKKQMGSAPVYLTVFDKGTWALEDIKVQLVYQPMEEKTEKTEKEKKSQQISGLRLAWQVEIYASDAKNYWSARVDAFTGELLDKNNYVVTCDFGNTNNETCNHGLNEPHPGNAVPAYGFLNFKSVNNPVGSNDYRVYAPPVESPNHSTPAAPADGRTLVSNPANVTASPFGWHDTNGAAGAEFTTTQGNNVHAYTDIDANNVPDAGSSPDGGANLIFDFPLDLTQAPSTYRPAAVTNLFYWNNYIHDFMYLYGFNEASGNFQQNNYGNGGVGNDYVQAEAQDGSGTNNANFATPPDGSKPRMQMYIGVNPTPDVDGDLDNAVIAHEYGHGISNRLTGGPANTSCLGNVEQMGEGWSDFFGFMLTMKPTDVGTASRGIGTYLFGQPANGPGIRPTPYSTNMAVNPSTYNTIKTVAIPHGVGYVWASMLWDLNWKMIDVYGFADGYQKTMQLVMDGMKLQPCSPGFVDGRNAILAADQALYGGVNQCLIWEVFARRGLGASATQGSSNSVQDGVQAFDLPLSCLVDVTPKKLSVCQPADAVYNVSNGTAINYTMSTTGQPAGTTVTFSSNPIPGNSTGTMTVSNTASAAAGTYVITVTATNGANVINQNVTLVIQSSAPAAPVLTSPANGAANQISPLLTWAAVSNAESYEIQVATDAGFTNIVASATGLTNTNYQTNGLINLTVHYWRVRAVNSCGNGDYSSAFSFTTANIICSTVASTNVPVPIPDLGTIISTITIPTGGTISDLNVKNLDVTHTWIDDLIIELTSPGGITVRLMNRPCAGEDNILINFDDQAATATFPCPPTNNGTYIPFAALSAFIGQEVSGTWTLRISDNAAQDIGTLNHWSLDICYAPSCNVAVQAPTVTQPTCTTPTGTIVVNATGTGPLEYSVDNGANWQPSPTFSGLATSNYYIIVVRKISDPSCSETYAGNPVVIHAPVTPIVAVSANGPITFCEGGSVSLNPVIELPHYLRMQVPYAIDFPVNVAVFGPSITSTPVNGDFVYIPDGSASYLGCSPYAPGSLTGKVAVIDRGTCLFTLKTKNAQDAGAIAVVIVNNVAGNPITMGGADPSITIPVVMVSQLDGAILKNMIALGTTTGNTLTHTYTYLWSNGATTTGINVTQSGSYSVQATDENGCSATSPIVPVTVNPVPDAVATPASQSICTGSAITTIVNSGAVSGTEFNWTRDHTADVTGIAASGTGDITGTLVNTTNAAITVTFTITPSYTNAGVTCTGTAITATVTVNTAPNAVATPATQTICSGNAIATIVNSGAVSGTTFNWTRDNTATVTGIAANGSGDISGTLTNTTGAPVTVTFTITPTANGCSGTPVTATVTVNSNQYFSCPGNMTETITDLNIPCFKAVNTPNPVFCGTLTKLTWKLTGATVLNSPTSGINYLGLRNMNVGTTTVTYTATFTGGVVKTCSFTVLVIETVPPNIYCPLDVHVNTDAGKCYRTGPVNLGTPSTNDNCGIASVTNNAPAVYNIGVNYVTWTVTDKSGNSRSCVQRVTVNDNEAPTITCPANVLANTGPVCSATPVTVPQPVFNDNCGVAKLTWAMTGVTSGGSPLTGINFVPTMNYATGVSTITYTVTDATGNAKMCSFTVTVKDVTPPTLVCPPAQTFCKVPNNTYTVPVLVQSDNCVIVSTTYKITGVTSRTGTGTNASGTFNQGVSTITWTVKDVNGNTATCATTVTVVATTNPLCTPQPITGPAVNTKPVESEVPGLSITAWPNPSSSYFNLKVNSQAKETLEIRMMDMAGKLVQVQRGAPGNTYQFGNNVVSGVYIIEVNQAGKILRTKVVKQ